ncbi:MAG: alpha/beta fold hydrolase [Flavobacteriales bacterium]|nr:alpha/beta fold hydrolase [Flavobacteriales bacterium]
MRVQLFVAAALLTAAPLVVPAQTLISDSLIATYSQQELFNLGLTDATSGLTVHCLRYATLDATGSPTVASGAIVVPAADSCYRALACYLHGTIVERDGVPSRLGDEIIVGYYLAAAGFVGVLPDLLGLGDSPGLHPYVHAASEASCTVDMLRAAREFCDQQGVWLNGQVFLAGYSQGGHACAAAQRLIEEQHSDEFELVASAPCSGPYDISGVQAQVMLDTVPYPAPYYLPYVVLAYGEVYPGLFNNVSEVFRAPYDMLLPPLFDGTHGAGDINAVLPDVPSEIMQDSVLQAFAADPMHPFRLALADNDLYDWAPETPTRLYYCDGDDHVFHENSLVALQSFQTNGSTAVTGVNIGQLDHGGCAFPALLSVKNWFSSLQGDCTWNSVPEHARQPWSLRSNLVIDRTEVVGPANVAAEWSLLDAAGRVRDRGRTLGPFQVDMSGSVPGVYWLRLEAQDQVTVLRFLVVRP